MQKILRNEVPITGPKSAGVKGINLKDDEVISGITYDDNDEYIDLFTNQKTAKRLKIKDLNVLSRAKRGSTLIKKVKSTNYEIINSFVTTTKDIIGIKSKEDIYYIKNSDIPIMDKESTGSVILKTQINDVFKVKELKLINDEDVSEFAKKDKIKYLEEFYSLSYAKLKYYDRYVKYSNETGEDEETTVLFVNLSMDTDDYVDPVNVSSFSINMLVNKHYKVSEDFVPDDLIKMVL